MEYFSHIRRFHLGMAGFLGIWSLILYCDFYVYNFHIDTVTYNPLWVTICIFLLWFGFELVMTSIIFKSRDFTSVVFQFPPEIKERLTVYQEMLVDVMEKEKLFLQTGLSLTQLASSIDTKPRYLSQILYQRFGKSFHQFVSDYRIREVRRLLEEQKHEQLTIEGIARMAGFRSKSSFNQAFKKQLGITPSQYIQRLNTTKLSTEF